MALQPEVVVAGAVPAATTASSPSQSPVLRQGLLRKLKTMKKRYFVLRGDSAGCTARLEYYTSEKKFKDGKGQPRKAVELCSCLGISATASSRASFAVALHTRDDCLTVGFETEKERDDWLATMHQLVERRRGRGAASAAACGTGSDSDANSRGPLFEHVWMINLRPKGLGRGLAGIYRLCLTDRTLSLVKRASSEANLTFPLEVMRRCGHTDNFFFVEVGRQASTGEGELWMEAEDALIAQSAHYAVQRAMRGANTNTGPVGTSTSSGMSTSSAVPTASTGKAADGTTGDRWHSSVGSSGRDSNVASSPPRYPETAEPPSPAQSSRFSTNAMSLLTRRFSSKSKLAAAPTSLPYTASTFTSGVGAASPRDDDRTIYDSAALTIPEKGGQATSSAGLQLDRPSAAASIVAASDLRTTGSSSSSRASYHEPGDLLLARSSSPVPAIEITGACKDGDDPYMEMSVHDTSTSLSPVACTDYMEMVPVPRFTCDLQESATAASLPSPDASYLSMQPRTPTSLPRRDSLTGSGGASPGGRMVAVPGAAPTRPSFTPSSSPRDAAVNNESPVPPFGDTACVAAGSLRPAALKKGGSQQQLLPDLFNLVPGVCCTGGSSSGNAPPASPGIGGTTAGYGRSPIGSTSSCHSVSAAAGIVTAPAPAPAFRSTASLSVPLAQWSEADSTGSSRLRTGSDAPTHRDKLAKQRSDGQCNGGGVSVGGIRSQPSQRQRSSSHGCVVSSLDSLHRSRLSAMLVTSARGLSESASSSTADSVGLAASLSPDHGSFEYVAMDFSDSAAAVASPSSCGGSQIAFAGASASAAAADRKPLPPLHIADSGASGVGPAAAVALDAGRCSASQDCGGDYVGIDFRRPPAVALATTHGERTQRLSTGVAGGHGCLSPDGETLLSEPFPELSCSPPPASAGSGSAAAAELPPVWPTPPRRSPLVGRSSSGGGAPPGSSLSARSRSRDSSLSFADANSHVAGSGSNVSMTLASDSVATCDDPYVMFNGAITTRFGCERPARLLADTSAESHEPPCDGYAELDLSASGRQLIRNGRPPAAIDDVCTELQQPLQRATAAAVTSLASSAAAVTVADIRDPPAMAPATAASTAQAGDSYSDSYAVMNFSVIAHPTAAATLPAAPTLCARASGPSGTTAPVGAPMVVISTRERLDSAGQSSGSRTRPVPLPVASLSAAAAAAAAATNWPGSAAEDRVGPQHGNTKAWEAAAEGQQQRAALAVALATPKIAMPVRATCYIKDDDDDAVASNGDSADNRRTSGVERAPQPPGGTNGQHSQSLKSSGSRAELGCETTASATGLRKARPGSVVSLQTSAVSPSATPPQRQSPPLPQQPPPPLPPHDRLPATAAVGSSTVKQRHTSGRSSDLAPVDGVAAAPSTVTATIVYATLDLEKAAAGPAIAPPRVGAAASARPSLGRPSSGGSLATADGSGVGGKGIVIARPQSVAGGSVQYSRIDFARLEALKAGKT